MTYALSFLLLAGVVILISFYIRGSFRPTTATHLIGLPAASSHFATTLASFSDSHATWGEMAQFWGNVDDIQSARLEAIAQAQHSIQFETFIMTPGHRADAFRDSLCQQAQKGIHVQLLADHYGAKSISPAYWDQLRSAGVEVRFFNPFTWRDPIHYLRRNHRKLLIIDQTFALIGGAGMSDLWDGVESKEEAIDWLDFEVKWQGRLVGFLTGLFWQHWLDAGGQVNLNHHAPDRSKSNHCHPVVITPGEDPTPADSPIRSLLQLCMISAQRRIWLASPYLLPDPKTCQMLADLCRKGIEVRILTMGHRNDKPYVYYVSREHYKSLLSNGVKIHEYQPSMMHAKVILIDDHWVSLGSANVDPRSFFHNDELNICSNHPSFITHIETFFEKAFQESLLINAEKWRDRPFVEKIYGKIGNAFYWQL
ncbi:MAG: phosphatidylserine/phosphatidylglycerophosphate/cardiolipin synthase family protein [Elainellaceae cyanobacterium]